MADTLINKQYKDYSYISRYATFPIYYNSNDKKYVQGITSQLSEDSAYILHKVIDGDTLDKLALDNYSNSTFYWIIADFNHIRDPFKPLEVGTMIKIPTLASIQFQEI